MADTSRIHSLVAQARRRLRLQSAADAAVLALIPAAVAAAAVIYLVRIETLAPEAGLALLVACGALVLLAALVGSLRRFPTQLVATRIDRASGLADRLASACAFEPLLAASRTGASATALEAETRALMQAAVDDAVKAAPRANPAAATRFRWPRDTRAALAFVVAAAVVGALKVPLPPRTPAIASISPPAAARSKTVELRGSRLCGPDGDACSGAKNAVLFGSGATPLGAPVSDWRDGRIRLTVPASAPIGRTVVVVSVDGRTSAPYPFEVLPDGVDYRHRNQSVALSQDDLDFARDQLDELRKTALATHDDQLRRMADEIQKLIEKAQRGELSKAELLARLRKIQDKYMKGPSEAELAQALKDLQKTGAELAKSKLTRSMGQALQKGDLAKAKQEMHKLAQKLASGQLSRKQAAEVAKALDKAAKSFQKREAHREQQADRRMQKAQRDIDKLEKRLSQAKSPAEKKRLQKQLASKKDQLQKMQAQEQARRQSQEKRALKRLHRNMQKASAQMRQQSPSSRRMASRSMEDMARDTGKVDSDQRKITNQKRVASQLSDLKEALRRARRGGSRGPQDRFGRNRRNADFSRRARGGHGQRGAWRPGQNGKNGQGQNGKGGKKGGSKWGDSHDPDLLGSSTPRNGHDQDKSVQGIQGKGPSVRETILSAAQKGFASRRYQDVYTRYRAVVEDVINAEKVPSGYKYYVKKYFQKIKPQDM